MNCPVAASRATYAVVSDDENQRKLLVKGKNNLAPADKNRTLEELCDQHRKMESQIMYYI